MSRLWAERLRIGVSPDRVELARFSLGGRRLIAQHTIACERGPADSPWSFAIDALDGALDGFARRGDSVAVVLSNAFVRYLVIPWQADVSGARELDELASLRFAQTFGAAAEGWTVRCSPGAYRESTVACAIDTALVDALRDRLRAKRLRLVSLQPLLMAAYNDARRNLGRDSAFATVEPGRLCLGLIEGGAFRHIVSRRAVSADGAVEQELATLAPAVVPDAVDVMLVGEAASWPESPLRPARVIAAQPGGRSLALVGTA